MAKKLVRQALTVPLALACMAGAITRPEAISPALSLAVAPNTSHRSADANSRARRRIRARARPVSLPAHSPEVSTPPGQPTPSALAGVPWSDPHLNYGYLRKSWETAGRGWMHVNSGVNFNQATDKWEIDGTWPKANTDVAHGAYNLEYAARGAINMAATCHDAALLDELSAFYLAYAARFTTLGALRRMQSPLLSTSLLAGQGDDATRTLLWIEPLSFHRARVRECLLCNTQFFHPVAQLIRVIAALPPSRRTPMQKQFVSVYAPLVLHDHLLRVLFQAEWNYWNDKTLPKHLVDIWGAILSGRTPPQFSYQRAMLDWDLWLIATSAEILGANASDPELIPLQAREKLALHQAVDAGVRLFRAKRTVYPETKNFHGKIVGSASYFNGDFDQQDENAYSGYSGRTFPLEGQKHPLQRISWDISHSYRIPVFLRAMYDNRKITGTDFPSSQELSLVVNQLLYRVFEGDFHLPLFRNYFDGNDGWYNVGDHGPAFGYPPSRDCVSHNPLRPCLIPGAVQGWGMLSFVNPDVLRLYNGLAQLAWAHDPATEQFRERYYYYNDQPYSAADALGSSHYPFLLFEVLSQVPQELGGCRLGNHEIH